MPSDVVVKLIERISKLEARVESLLSYQRWQMGALAAILAAVIGGWVSR